MFDSMLLVDVLKNPVLLAALFAIVRNILGYVEATFHVKATIPYEPVKLLETLTLYETVFILLGGVASVPVEWAAIIAIVVDVIRSFKKAVELQLSKVAVVKTK